MIRTEAESLDLLTFDRSPVGGAAVFNAKLGAGEVTPAREGEPADSLGHPILYVEKPVMKVGTVAHTPDGDMRVTAEACDLVARCTNEWIADGGRPFVPRGHRDFHENENLGWLKGMRFDGEQLWARHALIGADAHLAAARNDSSVMLRWGFEHGGKTYPLIVEHNAILPDARFKGLGDFVALSRAGAEPERIPVYELAFDRGDAGGHWVTIEGRHVLIPDTAGVVPTRVKAEPGALKRFTRGNLEKAITDHHRDKSGDSGEYTPAMERELTQAAGDAEDAFRFHKQLPTEIKDAVGENPALRRVFTVTDDVRKAHGADAFSSLGDRYIDIAEARAGSPLRQAKAFARQSGDPEAAFMAHVHDNLPKGGTKALEPVKAGGLRVGDEFTIGGKAHRVAEDEHGFRVLRSHEYGKGDVPLDAVEHVPVDKGSFRRSKVSRRLAPSDGIPFSRRLIPPVSLRLAMGRDGINAVAVTCTLREALAMLGEPVPAVSRRLAFARFEGPGHWVTIDSEHVYLPGAPGSKTDGRTVISHHEYDRINGTGAAAKAIAEHKAKGENGGMHPAEANLSEQAKEDLAYVRANPGSRADVLDKKAAKELQAAGLIRYESTGGSVKVHPATPATAGAARPTTPPATSPVSTSPAGGTPPAGTPTRYDLAEHAADRLNARGYNARVWHGDTAHRVYVKDGGKDLGHIAVTHEGKLDGGNLVRQKGTVMGHVSHLPDAQPEAPQRRPASEGYKDEDLRQHEHDARPRTEHPRFG